MQKKCKNGVLRLHLQLRINRTGQNSLVYMEFVSDYDPVWNLFCEEGHINSTFYVFFS